MDTDKQIHIMSPMPGYGIVQIPIEALLAQSFDSYFKSAHFKNSSGKGNVLTLEVCENLYLVLHVEKNTIHYGARLSRFTFLQLKFITFLNLDIYIISITSLQLTHRAVQSQHFTEETSN